MRDKLDNILNHGDCISEEMMLRYVEGKLNSREQHRVEKHLLDCELCNDAFEGISAQVAQHTRTNLSELNHRIEERINYRNGKISGTKWFYLAAAVFAIAVLFGGGYYYLQSIKKSEKVFTERNEPYCDTVNTLSVVATPPVENESLKEEKKETVRLQNKKQQVFENGKKKIIAKGAEQTMANDESVSKSLPDAGILESKESSKANDISDPVSAVAEHGNKKTSTTKSISSGDALRNTTQPEKPVADDKDKQAEQTVAPTSAFQSARMKDVSDSTSDDLMKAGIREYESKNYSSAIKIFESVLAKNLSSKNSDAAKWYLSLSYIKKNKTAKAKNLLEDLSNGNSQYKSRARKTLDDLK